MFLHIALVLLCLLVAGARAGDLTGRTPAGAAPKGSSHVLDHPGRPDGREGGETIADALVIPSLPFADTGNTCDNLDDYDEECPYPGSTSPDVVYAFTPPGDMFFDIDLCGSSYDTKVYVYDQAGALVACNDDYYYDAGCGYYTSYIPLQHYTGGMTYAIVVDGYGGDCGDYVLHVTECAVDFVQCHPEAVPEGEPPLEDGYDDVYNGGCHVNVFQPLDWINAASPDGCAWLCGVSGWYNHGDLLYRDTDWFEITAAEEIVSCELWPDYTTNLFVFHTDCYDLTPLQTLQVLPFEIGELAFPAVPGQTYWLWVGPQEFDGPVTEYTYELEVCGIQYETVPAQRRSWGGVKSLYR